MIRPCDQCGGDGWPRADDGHKWMDRPCPRCADMPRLPHSAFQAFVPHNEEAREWRCLVGSNYLDTCVSHPLGKPLVWPGKFEEPPTGRHVGCGWFPVFGVMLGHNPEPDWFLAKQDRKPDPDTVMRWNFTTDRPVLIGKADHPDDDIGWVERPTRLEEVAE